MNQPNYAEIKTAWTKLSEALPGREFSFWIHHGKTGELDYSTVIHVNGDSVVTTDPDPSVSASSALEKFGDATNLERRKAALLAELSEIEKAIAPETK